MRKKIIGVCGARIFDQNALRFLSELRELGEEQGYVIVAFSANDDSIEDTDEILGEYGLFELCKYVDFSCMIILAETLKNQKLIRYIAQIGAEKKLPVFSMDGEVKGCYNLTMEYGDGFRQMVRHVIEEHGARHVNMLAGFKGNSFSEERIRIYKEVLAEFGIAFEEERLGYGDFWAVPSEEAVKKFLRENNPRPDAIICANDSMAITTCAVLKEEGYRVPEDIIVTGFDGIPPGKYHTPILSTCKADYHEPMEFIFRELKRVEETGVIAPRNFIVKFSLVPNQSCGCVPKVYHDRNLIIWKLYQNAGDCTWHNLSMNQMVTSMLNMQSIMEIAEILPETLKVWSNHFHFACVKSELLDSCEIPGEYSEMLTILRADKGEFEKPGERFSVRELIPQLEELFTKSGGTAILVLRLLNSGRDVYGYLAEGFSELEERGLQRCNEFAMFLSHSINTVLHNRQLNELNQNLSKAYQEISMLSFRDPMTGVYNRRGFFKELDEIISREENLGNYLYIFSIDMDQLKYINDTFGHAEGDFAIISLAKAVVQTAGTDAICSRFGGDEFTCAVLLEGLGVCQEEEWSRLLHQNIQNIEGVSDKPYPVIASVGLSCCEINKELNAEALIASADQKMYRDKVARKKQR